jgi:hypothetical protein
MRRLLLPFYFGGVLLFLISCNKTGYREIVSNPKLFSEIVHELNGVVMGNNFTPVVASRNYAYASIAAYEVIAAGNAEQFNSLAGQLNGFEEVAKPVNMEDIDFEYAAVLAYCEVGEAVTFPEGSLSYYVDSLNTLVTKKGMPRATLKATQEYAHAVAQSVLDWSKSDNYSQTRSASKYTVNDDPARWIPTPPMYASASEPHWSEIRPMVMDSSSHFTVPPPVPFDVENKESQYYKEVMMVKNAVDSLTDEQKHIADFWDDNPFKLHVSGHVMFVTKKFSPPGHWMAIVGIAADKAEADFGTTVYAYAKTAIALFDAFIQCWDAKYTYNTVRPETVINKYFDAGWKPHLQTPAFPEYTCGHSTCSAAAAEALTSVFGDNFSYTDTSEEEFGIKSRSFKSFRDAAIENNMARFYGGIHFHNSCLVANEYGKKVGDLVVNKLKMKK